MDLKERLRLREIKGSGVEETKDLARKIFIRPGNLVAFANDWCSIFEHRDVKADAFRQKLQELLEYFFSLKCSVYIECMKMMPQFSLRATTERWQCRLFFCADRDLFINLLHLDQSTRESFVDVFLMGNLFTDAVDPGGHRCSSRRFVWDSVFGSYIYPKILAHAFATAMLCGPKKSTEHIPQILTHFKNAIDGSNETVRSALRELRSTLELGVPNKRAMYVSLCNMCDNADYPDQPMESITEYGETEVEYEEAFHEQEDPALCEE